MGVEDECCVTSELVCESETTVGKADGLVKSTFSFEFPRGFDENHVLRLKEGPQRGIDEDGDPIIDRKHPQTFTLKIEHRTTTTLSLVGEQVWRGALLLCDYILANPKEFSGKNVLEMGAGTGISSVVASFLSANVICTDVNRGEILDLCRENLKRNELFTKPGCHVEVCPLDWMDIASWRDNEAFKSCDVIIAADGKFVSIWVYSS
ncbi:unnamed protein product [Notodromas monacha]|uniref:Methyltransferase-like protein 22 n=1 Tax=Notodromas monacha TaxID=399045 RepID=A0A7R9GI47_9CRUS|nr:unnamed protein product [Notodromas monacha]CAG0923486.1 unnamed protein product [Notodromas monacha]